jgi:hypothetical protein
MWAGKKVKLDKWPTADRQNEHGNSKIPATPRSSSLDLTALLQVGAPDIDGSGGPVAAVAGELAHNDPESGLPARQRPARVRSRRISFSNSANIASRRAIARPAGVVRSNASVSDTKPTPRCSSSWKVASRSVTDRPSGPAAIPALRRSPGGGPPPAISHEPLASLHRSSPRELFGNLRRSRAIPRHRLITRMRQESKAELQSRLLSRRPSISQDWESLYLPSRRGPVCRRSPALHAKDGNTTSPSTARVQRGNGQPPMVVWE